MEKEPTKDELKSAFTSSNWRIINYFFKRHLEKRFNKIKNNFDAYRDWQSCNKFYREVLGEIETKVKNN